MAKRLRTSSLSLRLDVIVEENPNGTAEDLNLPVECLPQTLSTAQNPASCTVTLRNVHKSHGNEPQFLHVGKWPGVDMIDDVILESASPSTESNSPTEADPIMDSLESDLVTRAPSADQPTSEWRAITADQLSMVMDCWDPDDNYYPFSTETAVTIGAGTTAKSENYHTVTAVQQSLFLREVMDEYLTRVQTVEHIEELEDNDNVMEIVATLEGYRQNGWAKEMIEAFPRECWLFWSNSGLDTTACVDHNGECDDRGVSILGVS